MDKVKRALRSRPVVDGIAQVATEWMESHIAENRGRGEAGAWQTHAPLKRVVGRAWSRTKPRSAAGGRVVFVQRRAVVEKGKTKYRKFYRLEYEGYRTGGQPLRDTGKLAGSLSARGAYSGGKIRLTMSGRKYGLYQDRGFKTNGPNYIPISMKGKRRHATGANPHSEGLKRGRDFVMRWKGVRVPARPFILPSREDMITLGRSIYLGLRAILK